MQQTTDPARPDLCSGRSPFFARVLAFAALALPVTLLPSSSEAAVRGLIIGASQYVGATNLPGAKNDALDIGAALHSIEASDIVLLIDRDATRERIVGEWRRLIRDSAATDTLVLAFAGHGMQVPELVKGSEINGRDDILVLPGYSPSPHGNEERLVDDEINGLLQEAAPREVIFLADSCYSGTAFRGPPDPRAPKIQRRFFQPAAGAGVGPAITVRGMARASRDDSANMLYIGATDDNSTVTEVDVDGMPRGALSWAFAKALRGEADVDRDGVLSEAELVTFVREAVRIKTLDAQLPHTNKTTLSMRGIIQIGNHPYAPAASRPPQTSISSAALPTMRLFQAGSGLRAPHVEGVVPALRVEDADLVFDTADGSLIHRNGDLAFRFAASRDDRLFFGVIAKWRLAMALADRAAGIPIDVAPRRPIYPRDSSMTLKAQLPSPGFVVIFDLASDGSIALVEPGTATDRAGRHVEQATIQSEVFAAAPFGIDHLVVVHSRRPLEGVMQIISTAHGRALLPSEAGALLTRLANRDVTVGLVTFHTSAAGF